MALAEAGVAEEPVVLTGIPAGRLGDRARVHKQQWCREKLGEHVRVITCNSADKANLYCTGPRCVLVDDRAETHRVDWEAAGGVFVHCSTPAAAQKALVSLCGVPDEGSGEGAPEQAAARASFGSRWRDGPMEKRRAYIGV